MGIFSFFKRRQTAAGPVADNAPRPADGETEREAALREIARATALKIDAIEAAMSFDIFDAPEPPWSKRAPRRSTTLPGPVASRETAEPAALPDDAPHALTAQVDAIAHAFADGQLEAVEQGLVRLLRNTPLAANTRGYWAMLLDFYQITGQTAKFDNLAIDYACKFEAFPPVWSASRYRAPDAQAPYSGRMPTLALPASLDAQAEKNCIRIAALAETHPIIRIEFVAVSQIDEAGCRLLVQLLRSLQREQCELVLVGAAEMIRLLRSQVRVGRRDAETPWLLLLELLRLSQREKDYREAGMDFRVTYNVSPPAYLAPARVALADVQNRQTPGSPDRFMMPAIITQAASAALHDSLAAFALQAPIAVLDCSRLVRMDQPAALQLFNTVQQLAARGKTVELHDVNHLVARLLGTLHFNDVCKILHHRY